LISRIDVSVGAIVISLLGEVAMSARKTSVEINEDLLAAVQQVLSTTTIKETIEEAFREVLRAEARRQEVESLSTMRGMDLADQDIMAGAWRS
jgi:Arc/MetJ family transcription regulator